MWKIEAYAHQSVSGLTIYLGKMIRTIKIGSMNVRGLSNGVKRVDVFSWLKKKEFSIYCLQDIHVGQKYEASFIRDWGYEVVLSSFSSEARGVAVLFTSGLDYKVQNITVMILEIC